MKSFSQKISLIIAASFFMALPAIANECEKFEVGSDEFKICRSDSYASALALVNHEIKQSIARLSKGQDGLALDMASERLETAQDRWYDYILADCSFKAALQTGVTERDAEYQCLMESLAKRAQELKMIGIETKK